MCGIVGMVSRDGGVSSDLLVSMRDTMTHRGPDDAGVHVSSSGTVGLAQRRLAIVDLSPRGHQPMSDSQGRYQIVFNGEIYNHRELREQLEGLGCQFASNSDTEVILEAYQTWGVDCVQHFNGMFAFCLYDGSEQQLFLARDRTGEKPLFYYHHPRGIAFASELKALMADPGCPRELDMEAVNYYLAYGYIPGGMCVLKGLRKLPPAHAMMYRIADGGLRFWHYWTLPKQTEKAAPSSHEALTDELESLLLDSVRHQLQADVPVGILLSGGIDSSLVTALASRAGGSPVQTFTITFPGHASHDEGPYARMVARYFGTSHMEVTAEPDTVELLPRLAAQYDEPLADSSMVPTYMVSRAIREHATVALGGDGGDELFGGYPQHRWVQRLDQVARRVPDGMSRYLGRVVLPAMPIGMKGRNYLSAVTSPAPMRGSCIGRLFDPRTRQGLLKPLWGSFRPPDSAPEEYKAAAAAFGRTPLQQSTMADFATYLTEDILVKVDRASMLASLEVRAPWLDYRIIEFAFGRVPDCLRATPQATKILPRMLARRLLPAELSGRRKQGFSLPLASWFRGKWGSFLEEVLMDRSQTLFDKSIVRSILKGQNKGYANTERLYSLAMFELWRRHYRVTA